MSYDLIVIGGGPAGYVGAIRAAQLGKKVAVVEMDRAGGTCLNWGCIPTKALLKNAELYHTLTHRADEFGIKIEGLSYDWEKVISRSRGVSDKLAGGIEFLFKKNKVDYIRGKGSIVGNGTIEVEDSEGKKQTVTARHILVATGCKSRELPPLPFNGTTVIGSKEALTLKKQPKEIVIIGAGAIGVEFAYFFNAYGTKVTIVEMLDQLLPVEDTDVSKALGRSFKKHKIGLKLGHKTVEAKADENGVELTLENVKNGKQTTLKADVALVAIGVQPVLPGGADKLELDRGYIKVNDRYETSIKNVYAVGDIIGPPWLAHTASYEAIQCVEGLYKEGHTPKRVGLFPGCTYCHPQVASIGLTERAAKEKGIAYKVGQFPFQAMGKAQAVGETEGFVKLIVGEEHGEILGAHIIGENATELIAEIGLGMELEVTVDEIESTIHAHPTLAEAIHEATSDVHNMAIHI
ncbi:dihydrolipoyl dehydrogenase [Sulfuriroseicoccus oceanibius]|uniref:Dihydrolipoyl dehydrogenase n=1 Tax=Sulfuriroseicoccus oceanibius TaxID=2707525 RepID=A0A6B3LFZ9_9BACT|nr:dihydrolipoyl dehydrogenase [Sulfuriroseicoccus oceanibius]QQL45363.1 dihydrolipoyl dehydrogenase [Sulfuriroseicoccus oceanibius]